MGRLTREAGTFPPGRASDATRPIPTGSAATPKTIGIAVVTCLIAGTAPPDVRMTSTLSRTNSAAISGTRSLRPSAPPYAIVTVRPSIQPSSRNRCRKAAMSRGPVLNELIDRYPIVGSFPACCARAAIGNAVAMPPSAAMNSRRRTAIAT